MSLLDAVPRLTSRLGSPAKALLGAAGAAMGAWALVLLVDAWIVRSAPPTLSALHAALRLSVLAALAGVPLLLLLRASLTAVLERSRWLQLGVLVGLCALAFVPALDQARFLVSGDGISSHALAGVLQVALVIVLDLALVALVLWHVRVVVVQAPSAGPLVWLWRVPRRLIVVAGVLGAALLFSVVVFYLQAYEYLAVFLTVPLWVVSATLVAAALAGSRSPRTALVVGALFLASLLSVAVAPANAHGSLKSRTAGFTRLLLGLDKVDETLRLDLAKAGRAPCASPTSTVLEQAAAAAGVENVIFISIDTLRRDLVMGSFPRAGEPDSAARPVAPNIRAFAAESVDFVNAQTTYPATVFAIGGALTGLTPSQMLFAPEPADTLLRRTKKLLPRQHVMLPSSGWFKGPVIDKLFLQGTKARRGGNAESQTKAFIKDLKAARRSGQRTFAWLHYFDPHHAYKSHKGFSFGDSERERYLSEIAYLDAQLGKLMTYLRSSGWFDDSLIILFSDHGEALGEKGYFGHHVYLEGFISNVLLAVHAPALPARTATEIVAITDIAPTVLHALGLPVSHDLAGRSLFLPPEPDRAVVAEAFPVRGYALFDMANRQIRDVKELLKRVARVQRSARSYEPKASIVTERYRLIANRASGDTHLLRREGHDERSVRDAPDVQDTLIERLARWHAAESERIYCRVKNAL